MIHTNIGDCMEIKKRRINILLFCLCLFTFFYLLLIFMPKGKEKMIDVVGLNVSVARQFAQDNNLNLKIKEVYSDDVRKDIVMKQSIVVGKQLRDKETLSVIVSLGKDERELYKKYKVNELGMIPIIVYHEIEKVDDVTKEEDGTTDKNGFVRTVEAFKNDLQYYYEHQYRMIALQDMIKGDIDVEMGKSPIVLTFDGGYENTVKVIGETKNGKLKIDPDCTLGILESFKKKYPDFQVTATFFVNEHLFGDKKYNKKILKWLVENGYDVGNGTMTEADITTLDDTATEKEIGGIYHLLEDVIGEDYVSIVVLPNGSPYQVNHKNYDAILDGTYDQTHYQTYATLQPGFGANVSCFDLSFSTDFINRVQASPGDTTKESLEQVMQELEQTKYISDGHVKQVVIPKNQKEQLRLDIAHEVITYVP